MSEENYFKAKLQISKDTLAYTISQLKSADLQIKTLIKRHEYDLEIYNQKVSHLQQIEKNMEERLISLQKKIDDGYVAIDMNTGKGYKSRDAMHKAHLAQKAKESKDNYEKSKKAYELKKRKKDFPKPVVEPPTGEVIEPQLERELRLMKEKSEALEKQQQELKDKMKDEKRAEKMRIQLEKDLAAKKAKDEKEIDALIEEEIEKEMPEEESLSYSEEMIPNALGPIDETEINKDKVKCPECHKYYTKGGAFTAHYKTHYPNGKV